MGRGDRRRFGQLLSTLFALGLAGGGSLLTGCQRLELKEGSREPASQGRATQAMQARRDEATAAEQVRLREAARQRGWGEGHSSTVACLQGERAQTDGSELRCEDQAYVQQNYAPAGSR
jgi:hypothetical protein